MARAGQHALIIDGGGSISTLIEERLAQLGFNSFARASTEEQALDASDRTAPDLVVVGDDLPQGSAVETARKICLRYDAPALLARARSGGEEPALPAGTSVAGTFPLRDLAGALAQAQQVTAAAA